MRHVARLTILTALMLLFASAAVGCRHKGPSDEDLLDRFVTEVTGPVNDLLVERAIGYAHMQDLPIDVRVPHVGGVFDSARSAELIGAFRSAMGAQFYGTEITVRSKKIEITGGDHAEVTLALMTAVGPMHAAIGLQKLKDVGWKVSKVYAEP